MREQIKDELKIIGIAVAVAVVIIGQPMGLYFSGLLTLR